MRKIFLFYFCALIFSLLLTAPVQAICPVCTVAVGTGVGFSRWLGIDDLISGVWVGGLIMSLIFWFLDWLDKKHIRFKLRWLSITVLFYLIVILPLYWAGIMGHSLNKFFGIDKLLFGIIFGSLAFFKGAWLNIFLKNRNQGKPIFLFQKVVFPVLFLIIASLIFYLIS